MSSLGSTSDNSSCSGSSKPAELFEEIWKQLRECHQKALQELEAKVSKLKKDRCLDAQRLEEFYIRNQQLKEQQKNLQDIISHLEERLRAGECDRCRILEENLMNEKENNRCLSAKLKDERDNLEDENRKLKTELQKVKSSHAAPQPRLTPTPPTSCLEQEDGVIPGTPPLPTSLPVVSKLKKQRNHEKQKYVRYTEEPLPLSRRSLLSEAVDTVEEQKRAEVLVPETCEMEALHSPDKDCNYKGEEMVAETCRFELPDRPPRSKVQSQGQPGSTASPMQCEARLRPYSVSTTFTLVQHPDSTQISAPILLPRVKCNSGDGPFHKAKRRKEDINPNKEEETKQGIHGEEEKQRKAQQPEQMKHISIPSSNQSFSKKGTNVLTAKNVTPSQKLGGSLLIPAFKQVEGKLKDGTKEGDIKEKQSPSQCLNNSPGHIDGENAEQRLRVEHVWSVDPALVLSQYESQNGREEESKESHGGHGDSVDPDCTMISHSLLLRHVNSQNGGDGMSGPPVKANDSFDEMFDTTAYGEFKSFNTPHSSQIQPCSEEEDSEEEEEQIPLGDTPTQYRKKKDGHPTFAHMAVIRKKDERRKLKGTTCKECEIYYANLPDSERQKKLSACSRHRFLFIPPNTPENFWEVGFPSTQTCIERGYIKEDQNPQARLRRRQPLNALFSPKKIKEEDPHT